MEKFLNKKYKTIRSENYEKLLAEIGLSNLTRKFAKTLTSSIKLLQNEDGTYQLLMKLSKLKKQKIQFTPNEEFEEKTMDGRKVKSIIMFEDNVMIHTQHGEKPLTIERRFFDDEMIAITKFGDVTSTSWCMLVK